MGSQSLRQDELTQDLADKDDWFISFVDILLILLTLFVLLFALTKAQQNSAKDEETPERDNPSNIALLNDNPPTLPLIDELAALDQLQMTIDAESINLEINNSILYQPGSAEIGPKGYKYLDELIAKIPPIYQSISVEGHTDSFDITTNQYPSNWELSSARASTVIKYLINKGFSAEKLRAIGYSDTRPRATNSTAEGREKNRRVTIKLHYKMPSPDSTIKKSDSAAGYLSTKAN